MEMIELINKLITENTELRVLNNTLRNELNLAKDERFESESTNELAKALSQAQGDFNACYSNKYGDYGSQFADIVSLFRAIKPHLQRYELQIEQPIIDKDGQSFLYTTIRHSSGQFTKSRLRITQDEKNTRFFDSQISHLRRISLASILGIAGDAEDDNGQLACEGENTESLKGVSLREQAKVEAPSKKQYETITRDQLDKLNEELDGFPMIANEIKRAYKIGSLADLPKDKFWDIIAMAQQNKAVVKNIVK